MAAWLLYAVKAMQFVSSAIDKPQNSFLYTIASLPKKTQLLAFFFIHLFLHIPVWLYVVITSLVAVNYDKIGIGVLLLSYNFALCTAISFFSMHKLNSPGERPSVTLSSWFSFVRKKTLVWFYFMFLSSDLKLIAIITKLFSYLALFGFLQIQVDHYENRIPFMGLLIGLTSHAVLIFEVRSWEDSYLTFVKNLPIPLAKRYLTLLILYTILLVPEVYLVASLNIQFSDIVLFVAFGSSFLLFLHTLLYRLGMDMDKYIQQILIAFLLSFALALFNLIWLLILIYLVFSSFWYSKYYYSFETLKL
jgi:hypothetical protein